MLVHLLAGWLAYHGRVLRKVVEIKFRLEDLSVGRRGFDFCPAARCLKGMVLQVKRWRPAMAELQKILKARKLTQRPLDRPPLALLPPSSQPAKAKAGVARKDPSPGSRPVPLFDVKN
jgi:hypothetical protein